MSGKVAATTEAAAAAVRRPRVARGGFLFALLVFALFLLAPACAAPHRQKRVSDQRLAELETRVALNRLKGIVVTVPVGFGKVDPDKLGRRRRSEEEALAAGGGDTAAEGPDGEAEGEDMVGVDEAEGAGGRLALAELIAALQMQRLAQQQRPPPHWRLGLQMK